MGFFERLFRRSGSSAASTAAAHVVPDVAAAAEIAHRLIAESGPDREWSIYADRTQEHDFGWVFFYDSKEYVDTGDPSKQVPGCAPLIVARTGETEYIGSFPRRELAIEQFAERWRQR